MLGSHQEGIELLALGVLIEPLLDATDFCQIGGAEVVLPHLIHGLQVLVFANLLLPAVREHEVHIVVQVTALQDLPFVFVKPDAGALPAAVEGEIQPFADPVSNQKEAAYRAHLHAQGLA